MCLSQTPTPGPPLGTTPPQPQTFMNAQPVPQVQQVQAQQAPPASAVPPQVRRKREGDGDRGFQKPKKMSMRV